MSKIFDKDDHVNLPPELKGKTVEEVAAYYERKLATRPAPAPPARPAAADDKIDLFGDPDGSVKRVVAREVDEKVNARAIAAAPAIIATCRIACRERHSDFDTYASAINEKMKTMSLDAQMNPEYWEISYSIAKGEVSDKMRDDAVKVAVDTERRRHENPIERGRQPGEPPAEPRKITDEEKVIAGKFGMTSAEYVAAAERYETTEGLLPLTLDSKKPRQRKAS